MTRDYSPGNTTRPSYEQDRPAAVEIEQALIGCVISEPAIFDEIDGLDAKHFYEPLHRSIWTEIAWLVRLGKVVDPMMIDQRVSHLPAYVEFGGLDYLGDLVINAPPTRVAPDYAQQLIELWVRRELVVAARHITIEATDKSVSAEEALQGAESALLGLRTGDGRLSLSTASEAAREALEELDAPPEKQKGVYTGLPPLDRHLGPLLPGDLIVLGGRPGMGKSALAAVVALNVACPDIDRLMAGYDINRPMRGVIEINTEMSVKQMARRHLTDICQRVWGFRAPAYSDIRKRNVTPEQRQMLEKAYEVLSSIPLLMLTKAGMTISGVRSVTRRQMALWAREGIEPGLLIKDHVGHMSASDKARGRTEQQTEISNGMKALAGELKVPVLALSQLNRNVEDRDNKRPTLPDLRDSGSWEQDADCVIGVYRDAYYADQEPEPTGMGAKADLAYAQWDKRRKSKDIEALLLKVREGSRGTITLWGDMATNAIRGSAPDGAEFQ